MLRGTSVKGWIAALRMDVCSCTMFPLVHQHLSRGARSRGHRGRFTSRGEGNSDRDTCCDTLRGRSVEEKRASRASRESGDTDVKISGSRQGWWWSPDGLAPFYVFLVRKLPGNLSSRGGPRTRGFSTISISASISRQLCLPHQFWQHDESTKGPLTRTTCRVPWLIVDLRISGFDKHTALGQQSSSIQHTSAFTELQNYSITNRSTNWPQLIFFYGTSSSLWSRICLSYRRNNDRIPTHRFQWTRSFEIPQLTRGCKAISSTARTVNNTRKEANRNWYN